MTIYLPSSAIQNLRICEEEEPNEIEYTSSRNGIRSSSHGGTITIMLAVNIIMYVIVPQITKGNMLHPTIIEVGCGKGIFSFVCSILLPYCNVIGIELDEERIARCLQWRENIMQYAKSVRRRIRYPRFINDNILHCRRLMRQNRSTVFFINNYNNFWGDETAHRLDRFVSHANDRSVVIAFHPMVMNDINWSEKVITIEGMPRSELSWGSSKSNDSPFFIYVYHKLPSNQIAERTRRSRHQADRDMMVFQNAIKPGR